MPKTVCPKCYKLTACACPERRSSDDLELDIAAIDAAVWAAKFGEEVEKGWTDGAYIPCARCGGWTAGYCDPAYCDGCIEGIEVEDEIE